MHKNRSLAIAALYILYNVHIVHYINTTHSSYIISRMFIPGSDSLILSVHISYSQSQIPSPLAYTNFIVLKLTFAMQLGMRF